jgi:hypothetical protein
MTVPAAKPRRGYVKHGLTAPLAKIRLQGFKAIDQRTQAARRMLDFKRELIVALGGEADLSPQRRRLVDLTARAALILDHVDVWLFSRESLINGRTRTLLPVVVQRQSIAEHLAKLLDRLGLERLPAKVPTLSEYLESRAHARAGDAMETQNREPVP